MDPVDREFMRQLLLRHEKATGAMIARLDEDAERIRGETREIRARTVENTRAMRAQTREFVAEPR